MENFMIFEEQEYKPSPRVYAPVPLEYYKEMRYLSDEEFGLLMRLLLHFNITGKVLPVEGVLCHYVDRVIGRQIRFYHDWAELSESRSRAGKKSAESRKKKQQTITDDCSEEETLVEQTQQVLNKSNYSNSNSDSNSDSNSNSEANIQSSSLREAVGNGEVSTGPARQPTDRGENENGQEAPVVDALNRLLRVQLSRTALGELREYVSRLGTELCLFAVERGAEENQCSWKYVRGILRDLERNQIRSRAEAERNHQQYASPSPATLKREKERSQMYQHDPGQYKDWEKIAIAEALAEGE